MKMIAMRKSLDARKTFFLFSIGLLISADIVILLDIPFLRQIIGFMFLTILPGLLILQILKLNKIGSTEKFVLSVGLSVSFLMLFGLLINNLSLALGYETPLATIPLLISFNLAFVVLAVIGQTINRTQTFSLPNLNLTSSEKAFLIVPILFPALSIFGMHVMNTTDNNIILMFLLFLIPTYVALVCIFNHKFPERLYPVVIFLISISLLLMLSLRSNHIIIGTDTGREFYFFRTILSDLHWSTIGHQPLDACLSISLLPTIFHSILNMNPEYLFKVFYSLIFSISPLVIYIISKKYIGDFYAFLASIFFISQLCFLRTATLTRVNTAILFCALSIMVLFHNDISKVNKKLLFIIFLASVIVSHYSTTYIFFFVLLLTWFGMQILSLNTTHKRKHTALSESQHIDEGATPQLRKESTLENGDGKVASRTDTLELPLLRKGISMTIIVLFFSMLFLWYSQLTETSFNAGVGFIRNTIMNLNEFFILESRGQEISLLLGENIMRKRISSQIEFASTWMTFVFIGIGVASIIYRYIKMLSASGTATKESKILKTEFEMEYAVMAIVCGALLVIGIALPFVSEGYEIHRLHLVMMTVLSVCFILGCITLSLVLQFIFTNGIRWFRGLKSYRGRGICKNTIQSKHNKHIEIQPFLIILIVLIPYFLSTTGVSYQINGFPMAITLNSEGAAYDTGYIHDQESYASKWLAGYREPEKNIYANNYGFEILGSQGKIPDYKVNTHLILTEPRDGYVFLEYYTVVHEKTIIMTHTKEIYNLTDYSYKFAEKGKVYANGGSEVYK